MQIMGSFEVDYTDKDTEQTSWSCFKRILERPRAISSVGTIL